MEELKHKKEKFTKALKALERNLCLIENPRFDITEIEQESFVAAAIKYFELCYETSWKFLRLYLKYEYDLKIDSPKKVFRECFALKLIDYKTTEELLNIAEARNATTHDWDEETAQEICKWIAEYYKVFATINNISKS